MVSAQQTQSQGFAIRVRDITWFLGVVLTMGIAWGIWVLYAATPAWEKISVPVWTPNSFVVADAVVLDGTDQILVTFEKYRKLAPNLSVQSVVLNPDGKTLTYYGKEAHDSTHSFVATANVVLPAPSGPFPKMGSRLHWSESIMPGIQQNWTRRTMALGGFFLADAAVLVIFLVAPYWARWNMSEHYWRNYGQYESIFCRVVWPREPKKS